MDHMAELWMIMEELVQLGWARMAFMGVPDESLPNCCPAVLGGMNMFSGLIPIM